MAKGKIKSESKSRSEKKSKASKKKDLWPKARNVLFRPQRKKYVKKMEPTTECVFCLTASAKTSVKSLCVYKSEHSQIILNKFPYNSGHLLVLPLQHQGDILSLSKEQYIDLHLTLKIAIEAVQQVYEPIGFNIGLNHGAAAGAGIPQHLHYHLIPRWGGDLNFFPLIAGTKIVIETLEESYQRYEEFFKNRNLK